MPQLLLSAPEGTRPCPVPGCLVSIPADGRLGCWYHRHSWGEIVTGEEELGPQRFCPACDMHWPLTTEFWRLTIWRVGDVYRTSSGAESTRKSNGASPFCLGCHSAATRARYERMKRPGPGRGFRSDLHREAATP